MVERQVMVRCRVHLGGGQVEGIELRASPASTIEALTEEVVQCLQVEGSFHLASRVAGGLLPMSAQIGDIQLRHGELLQLVRSEDLEDWPTAVPLSTGDSFRLVSDTGPQIGLAWSVRPGATTLLQIGTDGLVSGKRIVDSEEFAVHDEEFALALRPDGVEVVPGRRIRASINGTPIDVANSLVVGSNLEVLVGPSRLSWRLLTPEEHGRVHRSAQVSYRVGLRETLPARPPDMRLTIPPMPQGQEPESVWLDILTLDAPMALMYLVLGFVVGFNPFFLVLPLLSVFRIYRRLRDHRQRAAKMQREAVNWLRSVDAELGVAQVVTIFNI